MLIERGGATAGGGGGGGGGKVGFKILILLKMQR